MMDNHFEPELHEYISAGEVPKVLVVDDSGVVRSAIRERLELGNLEVIEASSGQQALEVIEKQLPDIVLLDVVMPGIDGATVLKILRNSYDKYQLPIISVTSGDSPSEIVHALDAGANDYVTKPVDFDVLWARLSNQLMQKKAAEYLRCAHESLEQRIRQRTKELNSSNQKLKLVIQEKLLTEGRLQRQANYDELTGLPNRSLAKDRLAQTIAMAKRKNLSPCVTFIDLDNFKSINDTLGHAAGDELLKEAARRLSSCARQSDTVARLGGDEFLLILQDSDEQPRESREHDLKGVGDRIIASFSRPFILEGNEIAVSPSIGFAIFPRDGIDGDELMRNADAAMYRAKKQGKNACCFYTPETPVKGKKSIQVESQLRHAFEREEISLYYQPIIDVHNSEIVKAEVTLRWHSSTLGMVSPDHFIKVAEDTGLIVPINDWLIARACKQVRTWRASFNKQICVSLNVSACQLRTNPGFSKKLVDAINANGLPADALHVEITEKLLINQSPTTIKNIQDLDSNGIKLIIDDFGAGYASLPGLLNHRFDSLKIDHCFIKKLSQDTQVAKIVEAIIAMANKLGMTVASQGVETGSQLGFLFDVGCQHAQGPYFSEALTADEFEILMRRPSDLPTIVKPIELSASMAVNCNH
ncbi:MAG: EAL domain-containing protein [Gammaproteobacteria bacterium]